MTGLCPGNSPCAASTSVILAVLGLFKPIERDKEPNPRLTIWLFNIAMENGPFIDGLPIENGDFPWLC